MSHNNVLEKRKVTLAVLMRKLKTHSTYWDEIVTLAMMVINHMGSHDQVFKTVTDSFHLEPVSADTRNSLRAAFILLVHLLAETSTELKQLKRVMLEALCSGMYGDHFYVGTHKVVAIDDTAPSATISVDCKLCKSDIHCTADCPLPKTKRWCGIMAAALGCNDKPEAEGEVDAPEEDPHEVLNNGLTSIRGEPKGPGPSC